MADTQSPFVNYFVFMYFFFREEAKDMFYHAYRAYMVRNNFLIAFLHL